MLDELSPSGVVGASWDSDSLMRSGSGVADVENLTDGVCLGSGCHSDTGGAKDAKVEGNGGAAGWNHGWSISARIFRESCTSGVGAGDLVRNSFDDPEVVEGGGLDNGAIDWGAPIFSPERSS